jgi:hypothetical protein
MAAGRKEPKLFRGRGVGQPAPAQRQVIRRARDVDAGGA